MDLPSPETIQSAFRVNTCEKRKRERKRRKRREEERRRKLRKLTKRRKKRNFIISGMRLKVSRWIEKIRYI
jgi:hypothetical protein